MKILALEFASSRRSVAIIEGELTNRAPSAGLNPPPACLGAAAETGGRGTKAFALIAAALAQARLEREAIETIAIGLGPGSYNGIRVAIAIAQGWQLARDVRLVGIGSVECLAAQTHAAGQLGPVSFLIDAQRKEFYLATYEFTTAGYCELEPLHLVSMAEAQARVDAGAVVAGPEIRPWFPAARDLFPEAATLAWLAGARSDFVAGDKLEPIYLRATSFVKAPPPRFAAEAGAQ